MNIFRNTTGDISNNKLYKSNKVKKGHMMIDIIVAITILSICVYVYFIGISNTELMIDNNDNYKNILADAVIKEKEYIEHSKNIFFIDKKENYRIDDAYICINRFVTDELFGLVKSNLNIKYGKYNRSINIYSIVGDDIEM